MKVVAYGLKTHEKICLAKVTLKQHDITIIANDFSLDTINYAAGKDALLLTDFNSLTAQLLTIISGYGIKLIITWNATINEYLNELAKLSGIGLVHLVKDIPFDVENRVAKKEESAVVCLAFETIEALNNWPKQDSNIFPGKLKEVAVSTATSTRKNK